jgi:hypothetical protein
MARVMACCYEPKTKFKIKGFRSSRSKIDREGPELRLFGWGSREGFVWRVRPGAADKAHDENGVVVATESNDKPTLPSFSFTL